MYEHDPITNQKLAQLAGVNYTQEIVKFGPIVYSRTHKIVSQFAKLMTFGPCILVTSYSDHCVTDHMAKALPGNVKRWFANNVMTLSARVETIPIGIRCGPHVETAFVNALLQGRQKRKNLCYINFLRHKIGIANRQGIYEKFEQYPWTTARNQVPIDSFYFDLASHDFAISPPGSGPDCHRHWEAIALGCIPIVLRSLATKILEDLPCLFIDDWSQINQEILEAALIELKPRFQSLAMRKLDMGYWRKRILCN